MAAGGWIVAAWFIAVILGGVAAIYWGWRTGWMQRFEGDRYAVLEEHEPEPWPGRDEGQA